MQPIIAKAKGLDGKLIEVTVLQFLSHNNTVVAICKVNNEFIAIAPTDLFISE